LPIYLLGSCRFYRKARGDERTRPGANGIFPLQQSSVCNRGDCASESQRLCADCRTCARTRHHGKSAPSYPVGGFGSIHCVIRWIVSGLDIIGFRAKMAGIIWAVVGSGAWVLAGSCVLGSFESSAVGLGEASSSTFMAR